MHADLTHMVSQEQREVTMPSDASAGCRFDHLFGMFKTKEGKARRLDLIFVPPEELGFGTLGWIGGKQFLRFMRAYSDDECGMHLNSHRCGAACRRRLNGVLRCWGLCSGMFAEHLRQWDHRGMWNVADQSSVNLQAGGTQGWPCVGGAR